ncbi:hypothetical protein PG985_012708 [Apiospora marii]|uniref:uncharacterized protein n=1 Tax=Apiospora marii TaxID=335849 RepID=UPI0031321C75
MASKGSPKNNMIVLAVKEVSERGGFVVRARYFGLIRYFWITKEAAAYFPPGWDQKGGSGPLVRPGNYPAGMKCVLLRRPGESDNIDPRRNFEYPVVEPLKVKLTGIRLSEDRLRRVRFQDALLTEGPEAPSYLLKLSEFPHEWPRPDGTLVQRWTPAFVSSLVPSLAPPPGPTAVTNEQHSYDDDMATEMFMHHDIIQALEYAGAPTDVVPAIAGVVTERGRGPVGLLSEWIEGDEPHGGAPNFRDILRRLRDQGGKWRLPEADKRACRAALQTFHDQGYLHGAALPQHFLRQRDGRVVLVDFRRTERLDLVTRRGREEAALRMISDAQDMERWLDLSEESGRYKRDMALDLLN